MAARRIADRLKRRLSRPQLSVVIPCKNGEQFIEQAVRSVLNQTLRHIEVIVIDDASSDNTRGVVEALAARDRRVRLLEGRGLGPGAARNDGVNAARGRYLTFVDADDKVLPGAYEDMVQSLENTGSDYVMGGYLRHGRTDSHRPRVVAAVHSEDRLRTSAEHFPALLDEPVLWNKIFRTSFWRSAVGSIPEDVNYEDQEPCLRAALATTSIDVLTRDVYSWRLPEGRASRSQSKAELADLRDRMTIIRRMSEMLPGAPNNVVQHLLGVWLGRDLIMYAAHAFTSGAGYREKLQKTATHLARRMDEETWRSIPFWDRLTAWALAHGSDDDLAEVVASRLEDTSAVPIARGDNELIAVTPVLARLTAPPSYLTHVGARDLQLHATISIRAREEDALEFEGVTYVRGLEHELQPEIRVELLGPGPITLDSFERQESPDADYTANDPWRSYARLGYRAAYRRSLHGIDRIRFTTNVHGHDLESVLALPAPAPRFAHGVLVDEFSVEEHFLKVSGRHDIDAPFAVVLASSRHTEPAIVSSDGPEWSAEFDLSSSDLPSGGYFLRWGRLSSGHYDGWCRTGTLDITDSYHRGTARRAELRLGSTGEVGLAIGPPLSRSERTRRGQRLLIESRPPALTSGIFFESFNGKSGGDSPAAILTDLVEHGLNVPAWWSVVDGTVPVPPGAQRVVAGSMEWFELSRSASVLVSNNNFPHWFEKQPGQYFIQTWHGTPVKRLLFDAPEAFIPLTYRRLMRRQVPQWDLLLAQSESAAARLRSSTGYIGEVRIGEYPRNVRLLAGAEGAQRVRRELGLGGDERAVLYAPTWREAMRPGHPDQARILLDVEALAMELDAVVLLRSHHMNRLTTFGDRVVDVSHYPHVEDLFLVSDALISDYSSIFYDFSLTGRPAVVYAPDLAWYRDVERGFYEPGWPEGTPWPLTTNFEDLVGVLRPALAEGAAHLHAPEDVENNLAWIRTRILERLR